MAGLVSIIVFIFQFAHKKEAALNSLRREATNYVRVLSNEDVPAFIEDMSHLPHVWSLRQFASDAPVNPAFVTASQYLLAAPRLAVGNMQEAKSANPRVLAPLLAQDGASSPRLYASLAPEDGEMLDQDGRPMRWRLPKNVLGAYNVLRFAPRVAEKKEAMVMEPLPKLSASGKAGQYRELVSNFASRYNLNPHLVMAIIHSESDFSPSLVSSKSAMGLMQLLPSTASDEVHRFLYGRRGSVSFEQLRVPEINIRYGTAYLHILLNRYFPNVRDPEVRESCAIAAYNMGPNRFLRLYGSSNGAAVEKINSMSPEEFYKDLFVRVPARETRFFVQKVRRMKQHYTSRE